MQRYGVPTGQIRSNFDISISINIFYSIRRKVIQQSKTENIVDLLGKPKNAYWDIDVANTRNNTLVTITYVNKKVSASEYSTDICYLDDIMCTNIYGRPIEIAISVDPQNHS